MDDTLTLMNLAQTLDCLVGMQADLTNEADRHQVGQVSRKVLNLLAIEVDRQVAAAEARRADLPLPSSRYGGPGRVSEG